MKKIISFILVLVLLVGSGNGLFGVIYDDDSSVKDTPIAHISNDTYVPYAYAPQFNSDNSIMAFDMDSEITAKQQKIKVMTTPTGSVERGNYVASKPVKNAQVRFDGVPRYTDINGEVIVTLSREYVELIVEKEGFNPYIEIMRTTDEYDIKTIYLKQPNDDIEIYAAMLFYSGEYNILSQPCFVNEDVDDSYYAELTIHCNVDAEEYIILVNGCAWESSYEPTFSNIKFNTLKPGDIVSVQVVYQGIESKIVDTLLCVDRLPEDSPEESDNAVISPTIKDGDSGIFSNMSFDLSKILKIDRFLNKDSKFKLDLNYDRRKGTLTIQVGYEYEHWFKDNKIEDKLIYDLAKEAIDDYNKETKELNAEMDRLREDLSQNDDRLKELLARNRENRAEIDKLREQQKNIKEKMRDVRAAGGNTKYLKQQAYIKRKASEDISRKIRDRDREISKCVDKLKNGTMSLADAKKRISQIADLKDMVITSNHHRGITLGFDFLGVVEFYVKDAKSIQDWKVSEISLSVSASFGYKFGGMFMVWLIPCNYSVSAKLELEVDVNYSKDGIAPTWLSWEDIKQCMLCKLSLTLKGEIGFGIEDWLSFDFFAELKGELSVYPLAIDDDGKYYIGDWDKYGWEVDIGIGVHAHALFWDWEFGHNWTLTENEPKKPSIMNDITEVQSLAHLSPRAALKANYMNESNRLISNNLLFDSIYQGSIPRILEVDGKTVLIWVEDSALRDDYNRTVLKYSVLENGVWSEPESVFDNGKADFYFDACVENNKLYIVWQKANRTFSATDTFIEVGAASEIYYSEYNSHNNKFENTMRLTDDTTIDYAPKFAVKQKADDPLTVIWQKNSDNNIMSFSGYNSIYSVSKKGRLFTTPEEIYKTDNYITFVAGAVINNEPVVSFVCDMDGDLNSDDKAIVAVCRDENKVISKLGESVTNPRFANIGGEVVLFYYSDGYLVYTKNLNDILRVDGIDGNMIGSDYTVYQSDDNFVLFYTKVGNNGKLQAYCSIYDYLTDEWTADIAITEEELDVYKLSAYVNCDGKIVSAYNLQDSEGNTFMAYTEKQQVVDFEIVSVNFDEGVKAGERTLFTIGIQNTGDVNLSNFTIVAFNQTVNVTLEEPILVGQYGYIEVDFEFLQNDMYAEFVVITEDISKSLPVNVIFTDVRLYGSVEIINGKQVFTITATNYSIFDANCVVQIYRNGLLIQEVSFCLDGESELIKSFEYDYLDEDDLLSFEIITDMQNRFASSNSVKLKSLMSSAVQTVIENPYWEIIQKVKGLLV